MQSSSTPPAVDRLRFYRAVWRWHFYAGLFVLPFIIWLALTGAIYLYQKPIDRWVHAGLKVVEPTGAAPMPATANIAAVQAATTGDVFRYTTPERADSSVEIGVIESDGQRRVYYLDPGTSHVRLVPGRDQWTIPMQAVSDSPICQKDPACSQEPTHGIRLAVRNHSILYSEPFVLE